MRIRVRIGRIVLVDSLNGVKIRRSEQNTLFPIRENTIENLVCRTT